MKFANAFALLVASALAIKTKNNADVLANLG